MKLEEIKNLIMKSEREDWQIIACESFGNGPSYKNKLTFFDSINDEIYKTKVDSHRNIAVYKGDIAITMAYDLICDEELEMDWLERFDDSCAASYFMDVFYCNALVYREKYLSVDDGRCILPYPRRVGKDKRMVVNLEHYALIELLYKLSTETDSTIKFSHYFDKSGIEIENGE